MRRPCGCQIDPVVFGHECQWPTPQQRLLARNRAWDAANMRRRLELAARVSREG